MGKEGLPPVTASALRLLLVPLPPPFRASLFQKGCCRGYPTPVCVPSVGAVVEMNKIKEIQGKFKADICVALITSIAPILNPIRCIHVGEG